MIEETKHPAAVLEYPADFAGECVRYRDPATDYALNVAVRPRRTTGFQYKATAAGHTGTDEPRWPDKIGRTVDDGSVVWTTEALSSGSLIRTLDSVAWSSTPGITIGTPITDGLLSVAQISGGTLGQDYEVTVVGTCSDGNKPVIAFLLKIRSLEV